MATKDDRGREGETVDLGGGFHLPRTFRHRWDEPPSSLAMTGGMDEDVVLWSVPFLVEVAATFRDGRYEVDELILRRAPDGPPVTSEHIRKIPVARVLAAAALEAAAYDPKRNPWVPHDLAAELGRAWSMQETLDWIATVEYRLAVAVGLPPNKAVAERFGLTVSGARTRIARLRDKGYLGPARQQGKAGERA